MHTVISNVKQSKEEILRLFILKKVEKNIDEELKKCRWFLSKLKE